MYSYLMFDKKVKNTYLRKDKWCWEKWIATCREKREKKLDSIITHKTYLKID